MQIAEAFPAVPGAILVVEDDPALGGLLHEVLEMAGYDVAMAPSTADALALLGERRFVGAILDLQVLDGSTFPVADLLRAGFVPYVFASGEVRPAIPQAHQWAPFLPKPYPITGLIKGLEWARNTGVPRDAELA